MKANELRIGNWVEYPMVGKSQIRNGSDIDSCYQDAGQPILLTPEILEKCGFEKREYTAHKNNPHVPAFIKAKEYCDFRKYPLVIELDANRNRFYIEQGDTVVTIIETKHIHQLQNLYFALTGQELVYNTKK